MIIINIINDDVISTSRGGGGELIIGLFLDLTLQLKVNDNINNNNYFIMLLWTINITLLSKFPWQQLLEIFM